MRAKAALLRLEEFRFPVGALAFGLDGRERPGDARAHFRGRAFALFDIAYNLGFIVPALILSFVWIENDPAQVRTILIVSGAVFLVLTALVWRWSRSFRDAFAPQDDLVEQEV